MNLQKQLAWHKNNIEINQNILDCKDSIDEMGEKRFKITPLTERRMELKIAQSENVVIYLEKQLESS